MRVILVVEDMKKKNILFVTENGSLYTDKDAIEATSTGLIQDAHIVHSSEKDSYIRSNPNKKKADNLDKLTISISQLNRGLSNYDLIRTHPSLEEYEKIRQSNLQLSDDVIFVDGIARKTKNKVIAHITKYKSLITDAATQQDIDPQTLAAILIDEYLRMGPDDWFDWRAMIGIETTIGIAQVNVETARNLIKLGLYNPNPEDKKLFKDNIKDVSKAHLYKYLKEPKHSINFSAAKIRYDINHWKPKKDISNLPDIIGTLYNQSDRTPRENPDPSDRGLQIYTEFYPITEGIFD